MRARNRFKKTKGGVGAIRLKSKSCVEERKEESRAPDLELVTIDYLIGDTDLRQ